MSEQNSAQSKPIALDCALGTHYETGVITAHPIKYCWKMIKTIWATWRYARKHGLPADKWYGVYIAGTECIVAHTGCMPGALNRAAEITVLLNTRGT